MLMITDGKIHSLPNNVTTNIGDVNTKVRGSMAPGVIMTPIPPTDTVVVTVTGTATGTGTAGANPTPIQPL